MRSGGGPSPEAARMIWRALTHNLAWKMGALALAVLLWFLVIGGPEVVTVEAVPLVYRNLPTGLLLVSDPPDAVRLELRGPSRQMARENLSSLKFMLNLSGVKDKGERTFTLSGSEAGLPEGVSFLRAVPSQIQLGFDWRQRREVPVEVRLSGVPATGHRVMKQEAIPAKVWVTGPAARVQAVTTALTDAVDVSGRSESTDTRVNTFLADPRVELESKSTVTVKVTIGK